MKKRIHELVVVEGKSDTICLQQYYDVDTFETSGMGINDEMIQRLKQLAQVREILVLTDPDMPGEYIRRIVMENIPNAKHVIMPKKDARSKDDKKLGIEYATKDALERAFQTIHLTDNQNSIQIVDYTNQDMIKWGLIGYPNSKNKRDYLSDKLNLGRVNAKQFLKRLNMFEIKEEMITQLLKEFKE